MMTAKIKFKRKKLPRTMIELQIKAEIAGLLESIRLYMTSVQLSLVII